MRPRSRLTAVTAALGIASCAAGLVLLPTAAASQAAADRATASSPSPSPQSSSAATSSPSPTTTVSASPSRTRTASASPSPTKTKPHPNAGTTVTGPRMYDPKTGRAFAQRSTVTVSQTGSLVNEMVRVSWTGFTPSNQILYDQTVTDYPVMVAQCNTPRPRSWNQCYGANNGGVQGSSGADGPMNTAYATTSRNGTGELDIQVLTSEENQFLGCTNKHGCSLVIVPSQGGDTLDRPIRCGNHTLDAGGTDLGQFAFSSQTGQCSWKERITVPLTFASAPANCGIHQAAFTAIGSPMLERAMNQWIAKLCAGSDPLAITYNSAITEPEAIADLPTGLGDIALTTRPGPATLGGKKYTYAPLAVSAVAIAYWVDNPRTGKPVTNLKLDPRLVAKLVTQSYNFENEGCSKRKPPKTIGCDNAVDGNPYSLFDDPEFQKLNPRIKAPAGEGAAFQVPTVESGHSDMTWDVTSWMAANKAAAGFMAGDFDPWGMHVNTDYLGLKYPQDSFTAQDAYPVIAHKYNPVFPLSSVATYQAENWDPGTDWEKDQTGNFPKDPIEVPGERGLFAILDEGDAAAFKFPTARLLNDKGRYVAPTDKSMRAALASMVTSQSNKVTQQANFARQQAGAYPLTMVIYAMVPISGEKPAKAAAIARFLDYVAGPGQKAGVQPGELAAGYLPLTAAQRSQTVTAATEVASQSGDASKRAGKSAGSQSPSPSQSPGGSSGGASASPGPATSSPRVTTVALRSAQTSGWIMYALPALLIVGGLATLGGASSFAAGAASTAVRQRLKTLRRLSVTLRRKS